MIGSTGDSDKKRRHLSSMSPTAANAKKQPFAALSEEKKLDVAVLQFQNQKLSQKLEVQKIDMAALEDKFSRMKEQQRPYDDALLVVKESWEELVDNLHLRSSTSKDLLSRDIGVIDQLLEVGGECLNQTDLASSPEDAFLSRLLETGATNSCSSSNSLNEIVEDRATECEKINNILSNIVSSIDHIWQLKNRLNGAVLKSIPSDGISLDGSLNLQSEVQSLRRAIGDLHLKHKSLASELQSHHDTDAKNKSALMVLRRELKCAISQLEESNSELAVLKAQRDAARAASFPVLTVGNKQNVSDRSRDKKKDLQDMESTLKELKDKSSECLTQLQDLHKDRIDLLKQLFSLQNNLKGVKGIFSSQSYAIVKDQLGKAKADVSQYQALFAKLQSERDNIAWREKEMTLKNEAAEIFHQSSAILNSKKTEMVLEIQKLIKEKNMIKNKLVEASKEQSRKEIIAEFKALVSSFPQEMSQMQCHLRKYKDAASDVHSLRADVHSLSKIMDQKVKELEELSTRSAEQDEEIRKLHAVVDDLKESESDLKLFLEMFRRESPFSSEVTEARDVEFKAWARVQILKDDLDEHRLELRVKTAIEAEAVSQQRLGAAEAEIANLRQKIEASKREKTKLTDVLKSKHEETDAYLSEIETIGQAYDDMQTQNQQLLQQVTERDDYNIKLFLEGVQARQMGDAMHMEKQSAERAIQRTRAAVEFCDLKAARIEDQLKMWSDQVRRVAEDQGQNRSTLDNTQRRLLDMKKSSHQVKAKLEEAQSKVEESRLGFLDLQIELEKERFGRKRAEEELEALRRKAARLRSQTEGLSVVEKHQQELQEYKEILNCSVCLDNRKEVVITKCYHLFCNPCIQRILEGRHRKCPKCSASFGANDVKPVYI
ncbi:hypothetical protein LIER_23694 [Lithospermum erythrorhizon]|uniref:E3 ubiquitin protein ligase n=1 Tax=Lithospermum erythrorhizon TaxID=34254 RepID=A0AAV3QZT9_LITER